MRSIGFGRQARKKNTPDCLGQVISMALGQVKMEVL